MSSVQQVLAAGPGALNRLRRSVWRRPRHGPELAWAIAFVVPYAAVFLAFIVYPVAYGLWMARDPSLYRELIANPLYAQTVVNTALFVGLGVNVKMFLALLLSGFFMRRRWWIKALLPVYILPWALPSIPAFVSFHWMLIGEEGFVDSVLSAVLGIGGPLWFRDRWLALGSNIVAYIWKWMPFWTLTFYAGRTAIPQEIYEAATDGSPTSFSRCSGTSIWSAHCCPRCGRSETSPRSLWFPRARRRIPRTCWPRSASTTPSREPNRRSVSPP